MGQYNLDRLFKPKNIILVGADESPGTPGHTILVNLIKSRFEGEVYPLHPSLPAVLGKKAFKSVYDLETDIDLAIIAAPIETTPEIISACVERNTGSAIIVSDKGNIKKERYEQLKETIQQLAYDGGLRLLGPACFGFIRPDYHLNAGLGPDMPGKGDMAFVSQSGAVSMAVLDLALRESFGFSHFIDIGSMLDIDFGDMLDYLGNDYHTKSILLYMENVTHVRKFMSAARAVSRIKPILVLKTGRYGNIQRDDAADKCDLPIGEDAIYSAAFKRAGIIRVETIEALFDCAELAAKRPRLTGSRLAIACTGKGPGLIAADALLNREGTPAALTPDTLARLRDMGCEGDYIKPYLNIGHNASPNQFQEILEILLNAGETDAVLAILAPFAEINHWAYAEKLIATAKSHKKPIIACLMGGNRVAAAMEQLNQAGLPTYETPERAVRAYSHMAVYTRNLETLLQVPPKLSREVTVDHDKAGKWISRAPDGLDGGRLTDSASKAVLEAYGFCVKGASFDDIDDASRFQPDVALHLGATCDTLFGPIIYLGIGGAYTPVVKLLGAGLLPMNRLLALRMIEEAKVIPLLDRDNHDSSTKIEQLEASIISLSQLMIDFPDLAAVDINPLGITNEGIIVLSAEIRINRPDTSSSHHLVISPYPVEYESKTTVKEGLRIFIRPVRPEDAPLFRELFDNLSPTSIYYRFFSPMKRLSPSMLARFTQIDYDRDIALVALGADEQKERMFGVARIMGDADGKSGEFAVLVGDPWQGKGIGALLLQKCLDIAKARGFSKIMGFVLKENRGMVGLGKKLGFIVNKSEACDEYELIIRW